MSVQLLIVYGLILFSLAFVLRRTLATWFGSNSKPGCASGCGSCGTSSSSTSATQSLTLGVRTRRR